MTISTQSDSGVRNHYVYRAYDDKGRLLYVGCTGNITVRYQQHRAQKSDWLPYASRFRLEGPYEKAAGFERENEVIESELPYFNATSALKSISVKRTALERRLLAQLRRNRPDLFAAAPGEPVALTDELSAAFDDVEKKLEAAMPSRDREWRLHNYLQARNQEVAA